MENWLNDREDVQKIDVELDVMEANNKHLQINSIISPSSHQPRHIIPQKKKNKRLHSAFIFKSDLWISQLWTKQKCLFVCGFFDHAIGSGNLFEFEGEENRQPTVPLSRWSVTQSQAGTMLTFKNWQNRTFIYSLIYFILGLFSKVKKCESKCRPKIQEWVTTVRVKGKSSIMVEFCSTDVTGNNVGGSEWGSGGGGF